MLTATAQKDSFTSGAPGTSASHIRVRANLVWIPSHELEHPEWLTVGRRIGAIGRCSQWWIGDWMRYGTSRWGEKYVEAAKITGYDVKSLRNMAYVVSRFDASRRRDNLTFGHHAELAALDPASQDQWLDQVIADRLSVADLREALRSALRRSHGNAGRKPAEPGYSSPEVVCPHCGKTINLTSETS